MSGEQHDDHCTLYAAGEWWRIRRVSYPRLYLSCECGCTRAAYEIPETFDFHRYCEAAAMALKAGELREERGALPVTAGSEAWN